MFSESHSGWRSCDSTGSVSRHASRQSSPAGRFAYRVGDLDVHVEVFFAIEREHLLQRHLAVLAKDLRDGRRLLLQRRKLTLRGIVRKRLPAEPVLVVPSLEPGWGAIAGMPINNKVAGL